MPDLTLNITTELNKLLNDVKNPEHVDNLLKKLQDELDNIKLKNIPDESIEQLMLKLETLNAKIDHIKDNTSKSKFLLNNTDIRNTYIHNLNKQQSQINKKLKKLKTLTKLQKEIDTILTDSNVSLDSLKPIDYPGLKSKIETLNTAYNRLNSEYQNLGLTQKLTNAIQTRITQLETSLNSLKRPPKSNKTRIKKEQPSISINKAKKLTQDFDQNISIKFSQELSTHWDNFNKTQGNKILTSLFNAALKNQNLTLLNQLTKDFRDIRDAKPIIDLLYDKYYFEIRFETLKKNSESLEENYDENEFDVLAKSLHEVWSYIILHKKNSTILNSIGNKLGIPTLQNLIKYARSEKDMSLLEPIIKELEFKTGPLYHFYSSGSTVRIYKDSGSTFRNDLKKCRPAIDNFYIKYAGFQNSSAMKKVASLALFGHYAPYTNTKSISWAIQYLGYLETHVIPNLEKKLNENSNNALIEEISELKCFLEKQRIKIGLRDNDMIPEHGTRKFNNLVDNIHTSTRYSEPEPVQLLDDFDLSVELFKKPNQNTKKEKAQSNASESTQENLLASMNSIQDTTTPKPLANTGQGESEDMNSQGLKSEEKSVGVFQKHFNENKKIKDQLLKSSFTNVDQNYKAIIEVAMQTAISGLSKSTFLTDEKQKLLQDAKKRFHDYPTLDNLQTFLAICQAHRSSAKHSLFGSSETHSFTAFKNALTNDLKKEMFPEAEPKPLFNIWGRKK